MEHVKWILHNSGKYGFNSERAATYDNWKLLWNPDESQRENHGKRTASTLSVHALF